MMKLSSLRLLCPRALLVLAAWVSSGCAVGDETTGSESHFVRCSGDVECTIGTCEGGYCELDGLRLTEADLLAANTTDTPGGDVQPGCLEIARTPITSADAGTDLAALSLPLTSATLAWDGSGWGDSLAIEPESGSSEISVRITVDADTAERIERQPDRGGQGTPPICPALTEVRLRYQLTTADGTLDERGSIRHQFAEGTVPQSLTLQLDPGALGGTLVVNPTTAGAAAKLIVGLWWPDGEFSGTLFLSLANPVTGDGTVAASQGIFGAFSATGCAVQQYLAEPEDRFGENTIAEELALASEVRTFEGRWSDSGEAAMLTATPSVNAGPLCHSESELWFSGTLNLTSDDGHVNGLELSGTRLVWLPSGSDVVGSRGWTASGSFECDTAEPWPFATPACVAGRKGVHATYGDEAYDVLELYVYDSMPISEGGPADSRVSFSVAP